MVNRVSLDILYTLLGLFLVFDEALHDRRALHRRVEFAHQGVAVVDQEALLDGLDAHPLSGQRLADPPAPVVDVDGALAIDLERPGACRILPGRRAGVITPRAGLP